MQVVFVHDDHAAGAHHGAERGQRLVIDGEVQVLGRDAAAGGAADLHGLEGFAVGDAAADVEDELAQADAHGHFDQTGVLDLANEREDHGPLAAFGADLAIPVGAPVDDQRHVGPGLDVVDVGRLAPQAALGRIGRARARLAARPSMEAIRAVSSPQTKAPAPSWMSMSKLNRCRGCSRRAGHSRGPDRGRSSDA